MVEIFRPPFLQPDSAAGAPLAGAKLYFYQATTTTPITVYQDAAMGTPHASPVVADASGIFAAVYIGTSTLTYKIELKTSAGVTVYTADNIATLQPYDADLTILASAGAAVFSGLLYGLTLSNNGSDATNDIDIAAGVAIDTTNAVFMVGTALTKRLDANFTVGTNQGGLDTGSVGNSKYYVWLIKRSDTGVVDALFSLSSSGPTMPLNYDYKALLGSFARSGAANKAPRSLSQKEGTDFVAYTPTFTGYGTAASVDVFSRRVGDSLQIMGKFVTGTNTATEARITLGYNGTNSNVVSDATKVASIRLAGSAIISPVGAASVYTLIESALGYLTIGIQSAGAGALTKSNGNDLANTTTISFNALVPISGW